MDADGTGTSGGRRAVAVVAALVLLLLIGGTAISVTLRTGPPRSVGPTETGDARDGSADRAARRDGGGEGRSRSGRERVQVAAGAPSKSESGTREAGAESQPGEGEAESVEENDLAVGTDAKPEPPEARSGEVRGRIVDAATGETIPDVRLLVVRVGSGWRGTRGDESGSFVGIAPDAPAEDPDAPVELRVSARGYHVQTVPWEKGTPEIKLQPRDAPPVPGVVEGFATDAGGRVVTGRLLISGYDEMGDHFGQWADADASGTFRLAGMPPGYWRLRAEGGDDWVEVMVPDDGSATAHLRTGDEPWPGTLTEEEFREQHRELRIPRETKSDARLAGGERSEAEWSRLLAIQDLECRWRGVRPRYEVVVEGLPDAAHAHLRAATTNGPNHSWRVAVEGGEARFRLTEERWRLILEVPGEADVRMTLDVKEAATPTRVAWKPDA